MIESDTCQYHSKFHIIIFSVSEDRRFVICFQSRNARWWKTPDTDPALIPGGFAEACFASSAERKVGVPVTAVRNGRNSYHQSVSYLLQLSVT